MENNDKKKDNKITIRQTIYRNAKQPRIHRRTSKNLPRREQERRYCSRIRKLQKRIVQVAIKIKKSIKKKRPRDKTKLLK